MPLGTQWARKGQFNWTFDNMGGASLQEVVAGLYSGITYTVSSNQVVITAANGGGQVYWVRGVWELDALFAWGGFWEDPESGSNYYTGGSWENVGNETIITLGTGLPDSTEVQVYYIYSTGETAAKYDALNSTPCIREAWRSKTDYTYDFAVDRIFDCMAAVHFAYQERGLDDETILDFLWKAYLDNAGSHSGELVLDDYDRTYYDKCSYLIYYNSTDGQAGFDHFGIETPPESNNRALRFKPAYYQGSGYSAWFGYGFNWDLTPDPFDTISKVKFKVLGANQNTRVQKFIKTAGTGTSNMVVVDEFNVDSVKYYLITVTSGGAPGVALANLQVYDPFLNMETNTTITCPAEGSEVNLGHGISAYWESGTLAVGDVWYITAGVQDVYPYRLLVLLNDSVPADAAPFGEAHTFVHGIGDYYTELEEFEIDFSQFWRLGNIIDCRDRKPQQWGNWSNHSMSVGTPYEMLFYDVYDPEEISGETFYTKQRFTWNLSSTLLALGFFVGIPDDHYSIVATNLNYLIKQTCGASVTIRTKVRDAVGSYAYVDTPVPNDTWTRVTIPIASFGAVVHPLDLVDIGIPSSCPYQGQFDVVDLKFDSHMTFTGADNLRIVEFKHQEASIKLANGPDWYLDDFGFDLVVDDPYPYTPRLAISLNAYGRNPWRGPTLIHYSHPLAPYLVDENAIVETQLELHADAQAEFTSRYGGDPGPILPVHTRNDIENIALCGTENFNKFCWWPKYRDEGRTSGAWHFNEALTDASGNDNTLSWSSGSPAYTTGICQPGNTALSLTGSAHASLASSSLLEPGTDDFSITLIIKGSVQASGYQWFLDKMGSDGWVVQSKGAGDDDLQLKVTTSAGDTYSDIADVLDGDWHMLTWIVSFADGYIYKVMDGALIGSDALAVGTGLLNTAYLNIGSGGVFSLDYFKYERRAVPEEEYTDAWNIVQGLSNGSDYPEVGHALGQLWAFYRLGEYYFVSGDADAWAVLDNWLDWLTTYVVADGDGWTFPVWFSEYGFVYGDYDPGAAASIAIGCLYIYMRNEDSRALSLAQKILADLRENRTSGDYGGYVYKSDYHYAWMNALVAHAFGMAVVGRAGAAYSYPFADEDETHFQNMMDNFWSYSGDSKPNLLNADLIPFHDMETSDIWDYAPHYMFMKEMGSMEGVILMLHTAIDWALYDGSWEWFDDLLAFVFKIGLGFLAENQIYKIASSRETTKVVNQVGLTYGDYRRENAFYKEAEDAAMVARLGAIKSLISMHYGNMVITEDEDTAETLCGRYLEFFAAPKETLQVEADLSGARFDLDDVVKITSNFHGFSDDSFYLTRRIYDRKRFRVLFSLMRDSVTKR